MALLCDVRAAWRAPETFAVTDGKQEVSFKTDVYMFGVVILEVVTCTEPFHWLLSGEAIVGYRLRDPAHIINPYEAALVEDKLAFAMVDTPVRSRLLLLAQWCMKLLPADRPNMEGVVRCLDDIRHKRALFETQAEMQDRYGLGDTGAVRAAAPLPPVVRV